MKSTVFAKVVLAVSLLVLYRSCTNFLYYCVKLKTGMGILYGSRWALYSLFILVWSCAMSSQSFSNAETSATACLPYSGLSQANVSSFTQLNCAIQAAVPKIYVNNSFSFPALISVSAVAVSVIGVSPSITLTTMGSYPLFNVSNYASLTIKSMILVGSYNIGVGGRHGGLIEVEGSRLTVVSSMARQGYAGCGSAIYAQGSSISIQSSNFYNNTMLTASDCSGAIYAVNTNLTVTSSTFQGNQAYSAGAIYLSRGRLTIDNSIFRHNFAQVTDAGAILIQGSIVNIRNSMFKNNMAAQVGGAIKDMQSSSFNLFYNTFDSNTAKTSGGSLYLSNSKSSLVGNVVLNSNALFGGGVYLLAGTTTISADAYSRNSASIGGGLYCGSNAFVVINNTDLMYNTANTIGAGISMNSGCQMNITASSLRGNSISAKDSPLGIGGGCSCQNGKLMIRNTDISGCGADEGSAVFSFRCDSELYSSRIFDNVAANSAVSTTASELIVVNTLFQNNTGTSLTAAISCYDDAACRIKGSRFLNNTVADMGVVQIYESSAFISDCTFAYNIADGFSGGLYIYNTKNAEVEGCSFQHNEAGNYGGALVVELDSEVRVDNSSFYNNHAVSGGSIYLFDESALFLGNTEFRSNYADDSGGSIYVGSGCTLYGQSLDIVQSRAPYGGGIYGSYNSTTNLNNITATNNVAEFAGGAIGLFDRVVLSLTNSFINNNKASLGGAISGQYKINADITNTQFSNNQATGYGGVAYILVASDFSFTACSMQGSVSNYGGGAILVESSNLLVAQSQIADSVGEAGAAIHSIGSMLTMKYSSFDRNGLVTYNAGAIYVSATSKLVSFATNYTSNQAAFGGAITVEDSEFDSQYDIFEDCIGTTGSCVYSIVNSTLDLSNSLFTKNRARASSAGLLYAQGGKLLLQQSMFLRNSVKLGGVVSLFSVDASIFNTTFENNEASGSNPKGGALYIACTSPCADTDVQTNITFSRFLYNSAKQGFGGGIYINAFPGHVNIDRSTFVGNVGLNGGGLSATSTVVRVRGSTFTNNFAYEGGGAVFWIYKNNFPTTLENVQNSNNQASYGPFKATDLTQLNTSFPIQMKQVSGSPITVPINVSLLDYYGQVIVNSTLYDSPSTTIYCSVYRDTGVIKGSSIVPSKRGVATFNQLVITGVPGQNTTLRFSVPISIIADTFQAVVFRTCIPGEITVKVGIGSNLASCQECTQGLYSFNPSDTVCNVCPTHATCPGGRILNLEKDYWRVDDNSATILPCPVPGVCLGGTNTTTQCQEGNTGPYCTVCAEGYTKSSSGNCYSCDSPSDTAGEILSTVLFVVILGLVGLAYKYRKSLVKYYTSKMKVAVKNRKLKSIRVKGKILVAFAQIVYQLGPAFNIVYPISYLRYLNFYSIFQLNLLLLPNVNCIVRANYYDGLVATTLSPFFIFVALAIGIQFMVLRAKRLNERNPSYTAQRSIQDTITVSFLISYFVLVNASTKVFQVFQCETFDNGQSFLVADYSIDCNAPDRSLYLSYGSLMILIYPLGIPLIYATILFRNRKLINPDWRKVIDSSEKSFVSNRIIQKEKIKVRGTYTEIKNIKNLYDSYTPKRWYFELFDCARRLCLGAVPVLIFRGSTLQIIIVLIISLFSVATFMHFSPYIHSHDNTLAVLAQWSITLVVISAMIIKVEAIEADGDHTDGLGVVLIFLNVAVIGVAIMSALLNTKETGDDDINGLFGGDEDEDDDDEEDEESQEKKKKDKAADGDEDLPSGDEDDDDDEQSLESDDEYSQKSPSKKTGAESEADDNYSRGQKQRSANLKGIFFQKSRQLSQTKSIREIEMNPLHNSPGRSKDVKTLDNPIRSRNSSLPFPSLSINDENQRGEAQSRSSQVQSSSIEDVSNTAQAFSRRPTEDQTVVERRSTANSNTGHIRTSFSVRDLPDSDDDEEY